MTVAGMLSIFRMGPTTPAGSHEDSPGVEVVQFGDGATTPDAFMQVTQVNGHVMRADAHNPAPQLDIARKPDVGFGGTEVVIRAHVRRTYSTPDAPWSAGYHRLLEWVRESSEIKGKYPNGRYGLRYDLDPDFDCEPDDTGGYKIHMIEKTHRIQFNDILPIVITLQMEGASNRLNTGYTRSVSNTGTISYSRKAKGLR